MTSPETAKLLRFLCWGLWVGLLMAGLWPFNFFARNRVSWLQHRNGVHLTEYGEIYGPISGTVGAELQSGLSLELWLRGEPDYDTFSPILFAGDAFRTDNFVIAQSLSDLLIQGRFRRENRPATLQKLWLEGACRQGQPRFLTITSGAQGTSIYLEGSAVQTYPDLLLAPESFSGTLLLGHAPAGQESWTGDLLGLAFYRGVLSASEVSRHYRAWSEAKTAELVKQSAGFYPFDERGGEVIHDRAGRMPDLVIPRSFEVLRNTPLEIPAKASLSDLQDAVVNVLGFMPFGFFLAAYFQQAAHYGRGRALLGALLAGFMTSLAIELLQVYLPSRDSSLPDLVNNSVGTALGALVPQSFFPWEGLWLRLIRKRNPA